MSGTGTSMTTPTDKANEEQSRFWNEIGGDRWVDGQEKLDARLEPYGAAALDAIRVESGESALDVGCGCGATSLELSRRVGEDGSVLGLDLSDPMLTRARERGAGAANLRFEAGDAQVYPFEARSVDVLFSRFGVMFFADPVAAFTNMRRALRPDGRMSFVCWQGLEKNPWVAIPLSVTARHVDPGPAPEPGEPGPFSFADPDRVRSILTDAGFEDVNLTALTAQLSVGADIDEAVDFLMTLGPSARLLQDQSDDVRATVAGDLREALGPFAGDDGLGLGSSAWIVTAR